MGGEQQAPVIRVWDPAVRLLHWSLVGGFFAAWFTRHGWGALHEWLGYAVLAIVFARVVWGFVGSRYALYGQFLKSFSHTLAYTRDALARRQRRYVGHNPLGGWMAVVLQILVLAICASGWLYTTDRFWGVEWVEELHDLLTTVTLVMIAVHVAGAVLTSLHHRENLIASMFHGRKKAPGAADID